MTWTSVPYILSVLILLVEGWRTWVEHQLEHDKAVSDKRTRKNKVARRFLLGTAFLLMVLQPISTFFKDKESDESRTRFETNLVAQQKIQTEKLVAEIGKLEKNATALRNALSTNPSIHPKLRIEVLEHSRAVELVSAEVDDFEQWKKNVKQEREAKQLGDQASKLRQEIYRAEQKALLQKQVDQAWHQASPVYDFIVRTLQETIKKIAEERGDKVFSDYVGIPASLPLGDKSTQVAWIATGTNLQWSFQVMAEGIPRAAGAEVWLRIWGTCSNQSEKVMYATKFAASGSALRTGMTNQNFEGATCESTLWLGSKTHDEFTQTVDLNGYRTNVLTWIRRFIATHALQFDGR